ncbi:MAG: sensor histidine kinase [Halanaeroarchaeum sp.]
MVSSNWGRRTLVLVAGFGVVTFGAHLLHLFEEEPGIAILTGVLPPMIVSAGLIAAAWRVHASDLEEPCYRRMGIWTAAGAVVLAGLGSALLAYQRAHGAVIYDAGFVAVNWIATGALIGFLIGYYDARRLRVEAALRRERERLSRRERQLRRENDRLDRFAGIVSHDLRNPLNVAQGRLELARETGDEAHLEAVADAHDRMNEIVDETLELAREGAAVDDEERTTCSLETVAETSWETVATADAALHVETDCTLWADEGRLQHVFENLFRNAVIHGGEAVTVRVGSLADGDGFFVADDGPGLDPDRNVFEAGVSTDPTGTGLGLSIVEEIVTAHGWSIDATTADGGGARFEIRGVDVGREARPETHP